MLLEVEGLTKHFGGVRAVNGLDFHVQQGEILGLIGPNGAGKTTVFNLISGFIRPNKGKVVFEGSDITGLKPHKIARLGLVRSFQTTTLLHEETVLQNVALACHSNNGPSYLSSVFNIRAAKRQQERAEYHATEVLGRMKLTDVKDELCKNLPHGLQRALGVAIAMAGDPKLMLLDEPVTGMTTSESMAMMGRIKDIRDSGTTILLVEHDMSAVMNTCDRLVVLDFGAKICEGLPDEVRNDGNVIACYLGVEDGE